MWMHKISVDGRYIVHSHSRQQGSANTAIKRQCSVGGLHSSSTMTGI